MTENENFEQHLKDIYKTHFYKKRNQSIGIDGTSQIKFLDSLDEEIKTIARKVLNNTYKISLYKEKLVLKGRNSKPRVISIPTNRDKLLLKHLQLSLKESYKDDFVSGSIHSKINDIKQQIETNKFDSFIKLDIVSFFDNIDHDILLALLKKKKVCDLDYGLLEQAIKQSTVAVTDTRQEKNPDVKGVPQGISVSGILADIYLLQFDNKQTKNGSYRYYRFVDDMLVLCNKDDADSLRQEMVSDLNLIALETHVAKKDSHKTSFGCIKNGFQFLGYQFKGSQISVRPSSIDKAYKGINKVFLEFHKHADEKNLDELYKRLNLKVTGCVVDEKQYGWLFYFSFINDKTLLYKLDAYMKNACKRFDVPYDASAIKKYSRAYFELKNLEKSNYIPKYGSPGSLGRETSMQIKTDQEADDIGLKILEDIEDDVVFY